MNNCLLCFNCVSEGGYEEGFYGYSCYERELENDKRFPYKNTKCKKFKEDNCIASLCNKNVDNKLWDSITWKTY